MGLLFFCNRPGDGRAGRARSPECLSISVIILHLSSSRTELEFIVINQSRWASYFRISAETKGVKIYRDSCIFWILS
ncbi:MAG: hypothetical protein DSY89_10240 [Deltaproteobacteria bacterium]|nr:MAG: hypothetical protein DSY89_10240 [Deltaproteobacteria bacterium]